MSKEQYRLLDEYRKLKRYTKQLDKLIESGEFFLKKYSERRKLVRRAVKLYKRLIVPYGSERLRPVLVSISAGLMGLAGMNAAAQDWGFPTFAEGVSQPFGLEAPSEVAAYFKPVVRPRRGGSFHTFTG